ncbi:alpha/beta hydrolase [Roseobacteraceae bacterium NS-SX3]
MRRLRRALRHLLPRAHAPAGLAADFDPAAFAGGLDAYFAKAEGRYADITPGTEKRVVWAGEREARTPVSLVYIHGFSATSEEIRPVPDRVAKALGANLIFTRLTGHGRSGAALAEATVHDWMLDVAEALAAGRAAGQRVAVMATSTGATLMTAAAADRALCRDVAALVLLSPNYGLNHPAAGLLTWPGARYWLPPLAGRSGGFEPRTAEQAAYWTASYPSLAALPMAELVRAVRRLDLSAIDVPALFVYSAADRVVRPALIEKAAACWGGACALQELTPGPGDDPYAHVLAGDLMSPGQTGAAVRCILKWLREQGFE